MQLQGKKAIITGGAEGIGASTARAYVREGASVVLLDIQDEKGEQFAAELNAEHPGVAKYYHCDKSKSAEVKDIFKKAIEHLGGVDVLADVAGVSAMLTAPQDITEEQMDWVIGVNLKGTIFTNQAVYHVMKDSGGGSIINYASSAALVPIGVADYGAAKAGVCSWGRHVANAWGPDNIRVNTICPSSAHKNLLAKLEGEARKKHEAHLERIRAGIPLRRMGYHDRDLAPCMVFLASEGSSYITGQIIVIDGGGTQVR